MIGGLKIRMILGCLGFGDIGERIGNYNLGFIEIMLQSDGRNRVLKMKYEKNLWFVRQHFPRLDPQKSGIGIF